MTPGRAGVDPRPRQIATLTAGTSPAATLGYDNAGDTTTDERGRELTYDAWGQLASVLDPATNHLSLYATDALGRRVGQQDATRADAGPVLVVNNGSAQRSMVDSLTVVFPSPVTLSPGALTLSGRSNGTPVGSTLHT